MARSVGRRHEAADPAPETSIATVSETLGARIRQVRQAAGFTVRGLAARADVSPSLISQIERGRATPSVATLWAVATELGIPIGDLFNGPDRASKSSGVSPVQSQGTRKTITLAGGVRWERLTADADADLEFIYIVYPPGAESCSPDALSRHGGREYGFVISGTLGVQIGFESYTLPANASVSFDSTNPHRLWAIGDEPAVAIWAVLNRRGEEPDPFRS
jgi:transcriptional regulator with XRE-family HTH domain